MTTQFIEGSHSEFIEYLFNTEPKLPGEIQLESLPIEPNKNLGLHSFEQLLQIFVDGLKFFYGDSNGKVNLSTLKKKDIEKMNQYFLSMNYQINVEVFETIHEYKFKYPNYFKHQQQIQTETKLEDFYYEIFNENNCAFRISFTNL